MELKIDFLKKGIILQQSANITKLDSDSILVWCIWLSYYPLHTAPPPPTVTLPIIMCFGLMLGVSALQILLHILQWYDSMHLW